MTVESHELDFAAMHSQITVFNAFALLGVFSIAAASAPALFSPHVRRPRTWFCVLTSWLIYSLSFVLLIGRQTGREPLFGVCFLQAALIYASPSLCSAAYTCFAIGYHLKVATVISHAKQVNRRILSLLEILPWMVFVGVCIEVMVVVDNPSIVERDASHFYCHITSSIPSITTAVIIFISGGILIPLQVYTALILYRNWAAFRRLTIDRAGISFSVFVRIGLFTLIGGIGLGLSLFVVPRIKDSVAAWSLVLPILPIVAAICFGTQWDIVNAWMFWRKPPLITDAVSQRTPSAREEFNTSVRGSLMTIDFDGDDCGRMANSRNNHRSSTLYNIAVSQPSSLLTK